MSLFKTRTQICLTCSQFSLCAVHWGADCKRQGGKKIPRMKAISIDARWDADKSRKPNKPERAERLEQPNETGSLILKMYEQIKTKVMQW